MERRLSYLSLKNMILISNWCRKAICLSNSQIKGVSEARGLY